MRSHITKTFRLRLADLPQEIQKQAKQAYRLFKADPFHNSLQFKLINPQSQLYSVRVGRRYRALGIRKGDTIAWF